MPPSLPPSQMLKAVAEITDSSVKAVEMVKQQQGEKICWGNNHSVMSLGMWSPLAVAVPGCPLGSRGQGCPSMPQLST